MSKVDNFSDSMNDVVDTIGPVLQVFINEVVKKEMSDCNFVYDPQLSYETAVKKFRKDSNMNQDTLSALPLFAFNRSVLRWPENGIAPNRRVTSSQGVVRLADNSAVIYTPIYGEFDVNFFYVNKVMQDIEKFEITYLSDEGISGTKEIVLAIPELGDFKYFIEYGELDSLEINADDNYYKALIGKIVIRGMFFTFRSNSPIITNIKASYNSWLDDVTVNELDNVNIQGNLNDN
jgi:hypothetical protein